jgi:hypothetical protein
VLSELTSIIDETSHNNLSGLGGGGTIMIEHAEVNMNVGSIANDYDARRAGEAALDEMVRIARKSGSRSVTRR